MNLLQAIILGAIQGLTEFIPISSSAHLIILRWLFGWSTQGLVFDVALHLGTLLALFLYFGPEWFGMVKSYFDSTRFARARAADPVPRTQRILLWPVIFACVPAGLAGMLLENTVESSFRDKPLLIALTLAGLGIVLYLADRTGRKSRPMNAVRIRDWLVIGLAQALAVIPGVSRSGITITAGLFCGLEREAAARFSFLLGAPIILAAGVFELAKASAKGFARADLLPLVVGVLVSTLVGYLCIGFLIGYLKKHSSNLFVAYRVALAAGLILFSLLGYLKPG